MAPSRLRALAVVAASVLVATALVKMSTDNAAEDRTASKEPSATLVVLASPDSALWVQLLRASGAAAREGTLSEIISRRAGVVPAGARLVASQRAQLRDCVASGAKLVVANAQLLDVLNLHQGPSKSVSAVTNGDVTLPWPSARNVRPLTWSKSGGFQVLAKAGDSPLVATARRGDGEVMAVSVNPFEPAMTGYELLPFLGRDAVSWIRAPRGPERVGGEVYLDPVRWGNVDSNSLAQQLGGMKAVHIAVFRQQLPRRSTFSYRKLLDALHARGVLVYAWLDPAADERLWLAHPECRERAQGGEYASGESRRPLALEDEGCFEMAWRSWQGALGSFPWDGVSMNSLRFDSGGASGGTTPFHPSALAGFGADPRRDLSGFQNWRRETVVRVDQKLLNRLNGLPNASQMDFELIVLHDPLGPPIDDGHGIDIDRLAAVARAAGSSLQVQAPPDSTDWGSPGRYNEAVSRVSGLMPPGQAFLSVDLRSESSTPMTGAAFDLTVMAAGQASDRVALLAAGPLKNDDLVRLPTALAATAKCLDPGVIADRTVRVFAPGGAEFGRLRVDGRQWPAGRGQAVVPGGEHHLEWLPGPPDVPSLLRFTGELGSSTVESKRLSLTYSSRSSVFAVTDSTPTGLVIDGGSSPVHSTPRPEGGVTLRLPAGTHTAVAVF